MAYKQVALISNSSGGCKNLQSLCLVRTLFFIEGTFSLYPHVVGRVKELHGVWNLFFFDSAACTISVLQPEIKPAPLVAEAQGLNHWIIRQVPMEFFLKGHWSYSCGFHLHDLIISQLPLLQMPSHWGLGFNMWLLCWHQYSVSSALGRKWPWDQLGFCSRDLGRRMLSFIRFWVTAGADWSLQD